MPTCCIDHVNMFYRMIIKPEKTQYIEPEKGVVPDITTSFREGKGACLCFSYFFVLRKKEFFSFDL